MIKLVINGKNHQLVEKEDLNKLMAILKKHQKIDDDMFESFLRELK